MLGGIASGWCGGGGGVEKGPGGPGGVYGMRKERTSETQLIKYVPGSTEQKCVCGFSGVSLFFFEIFVSVATLVVCGSNWSGWWVGWLLSSSQTSGGASKKRTTARASG